MSQISLLIPPNYKIQLGVDHVYNMYTVAYICQHPYNLSSQGGMFYDHN